MAKIQTEIAAVMCCYFMWRSGYVPQTIINVGVGSGPEYKIWKWLHPDAAVVGIDPKKQRTTWGGDYIQAIASDGRVASATWCGRCRSPLCRWRSHHEALGRHTTLPCTTIDAVARRYKPPYFIWMDIDGGEVAAIRGARRTIRDADWINVEVEGEDNRQIHLKESLASCGFVEVFKHQTTDRLFRKKNKRRWRHVKTSQSNSNGHASLAANKLAAIETRVRDEHARFRKLSDSHPDKAFLSWHANALYWAMELFEDKV